MTGAATAAGPHPVLVGPRACRRRADAARRDRPRRDRRGPGRRDRRALLLGQPQRLADVPGRRPDLARHERLAPRGRTGRLRVHELRVADAARAADVDHRLELDRAPPPDDRPAGRRARPDRDARRLRHRRAARGPPRRPLVRRRVRRGAVRRDPVLRRPLPRQLGRPAPPPGARADPAGGLPVRRGGSRRGRAHRPRPRGRGAAGGGPGRDVRRRRPRAEAGQRAVPRSRPPSPSSSPGAGGTPSSSGSRSCRRWSR